MKYIEIFLMFISFLLCCYLFRNKNGLPTNWPFLGMLPSLLGNVHRIHDWCKDLAGRSHLTFHFRGPWFTDMSFLLTVDPTNVHYIMSKNFENYPKGSKFNEIFDVLGDGIFNADFDMWKFHRRMAQSFIGHPQFHRFLFKEIWEEIEKGLIPVLDHASKHGSVVDLQDLFERFTFDTICKLVMGHDLGSLCIDLPSVPFSKALDDVEEVILHRHVVPMNVWKFLRWLGIGKEKKYGQAWKVLDDFIYKCIAKKREEMRHESTQPMEDHPEQGADLLTLYLNQEKNVIIDSGSDKFLRDTILNFFIAGRDTSSVALSWFFYLLSKNPRVESKIREELEVLTSCSKDESEHEVFNFSKLFKEFNDKLIYLHAAVCEALRLYPPVVFEAKGPAKPDVLPSGHKVSPSTQIVFNLYAMARMKSIWGDDCNEFRPERWISERGKIKHEPSYKFLAFNAGPRTCVGKDMAFIQMKVVAASIIHNYHIQAVEGHPVVPDISIMLHMKHGFKVKVLSKVGK